MNTNTVRPQPAAVEPVAGQDKTKATGRAPAATSEGRGMLRWAGLAARPPARGALGRQLRTRGHSLPSLDAVTLRHTCQGPLCCSGPAPTEPESRLVSPREENSTGHEKANRFSEGLPGWDTTRVAPQQDRRLRVTPGDVGRHATEAGPPRNQKQAGPFSFLWNLRKVASFSGKKNTRDCMSPSSGSSSQSQQVKCRSRVPPEG